MEINEARLNVHMTHMEDLVLLGKEGLDELNNYIEKFINKDSESINKTTKIDGAPAVVCWSKFPGHADNSICLKSFVNGNKNDITSLEDLNKYDERPRMKEMLTHCLELAKYIPEGQAWQGDCLFIKDTLQEREIDGKTYLTFQPNKIIYAFDKGADYDRIMAADFGIAFHTIYYPARDGIRQGFKVDATKIDAPEKFYIMSPAIKSSIADEDGATQEIKRLYDKLLSLESKLNSDPAYEDLCNNEAFMKYWNTFENANLSDKKATNLDIYTFYGDLVQYVNDKMKKEYDTKVSKLKTDKGKAAAEEHYQTALLELQYTLEQNKKLLSTLVETLNCAADIKMEMWKALKDSELGYSTYYQKKTGEYEKGHSEGVAMSDQDGNIVKIVDRSQFSNINRSDEYTSGFDHNESLEEGVDDEYVLSDHIERLLLNSGFHENEAFSNTTHGRQRAFIYSFGSGNDDSDFISIHFNYDYDGGVEVEYWSKNVPFSDGSGYYTKDFLTEISKETFKSEDEFLNWFAKFNESLDEDTKKKRNGKWVNKGDDGEHGEFKTKKAADAQRKAMFANGYHESLDQDRDAKEIKQLKELGFEPVGTGRYMRFTFDDSKDEICVSRLDRDDFYNGEWDLWFNSETYGIEKEMLFKTFDELLSYIYDVNESLKENIAEFRLSKEMKQFYDILKSSGFKRSDEQGTNSDSFSYKFADGAEIIVDIIIYNVNGSYRIKMFLTDKHGWNINDATKTFFNANDAIEYITNLTESLTESVSDTVSFAFGKFNIPTYGHKKLVDTILAQAKDARLYLSHTPKPLSYDRKIYWFKKAFPEINVVESDAKTALQVATDLSNEGVNKIIFVGGSDRAGGDSDKKDLGSQLQLYNNKPDKNGNIVYSFDDVKVVRAGEERVEKPVEEIYEKIKKTGKAEETEMSSSLARYAVQMNDLEVFKMIVPLNDSDAQDLFNELKGIMNESLTEASEKVEGFITIQHDGNSNKYPLLYGKSSKSYSAILGKDHYYKDWKNSKIDKLSLTVNNTTTTFKDIIITNWNTDRVRFICDNKITIDGVAGKAPGMKDERAVEEDQTVVDKILNGLKSIYKYDDIVLVDKPESKGSSNSKIYKVYEDIFGIKTKDAYSKFFFEKDVWNTSNTDEQDKIGESIADSIYHTIVSKNGKRESKNFYISTKSGETTTSINLSLPDFENSLEVFNPMLTNLSSDEKKLLSSYFDIVQGNAKTTSLSLGKDGRRIDEWFYMFDTSKVRNKSFLNFSRNSYRKYYTYVNKIGDNVIIKDIDDIISKIKNVSIDKCWLTHRSFCCQYSVSGVSYVFYIRPRGYSNLYIDIRPAKIGTPRGERIESLKGLDYLENKFY